MARHQGNENLDQQEGWQHQDLHVRGRSVGGAYKRQPVAAAAALVCKSKCDMADEASQNIV